MLTSIAVDTHTHTVISGHAWSTLAENAKAAAERGLYGLCLTEHGPDIPGGGVDYLPAAQVMLPEIVNGIRIYRGTEANITNFDGVIDIETRFINRTEFAIASLHDIVMKPGTSQQNTGALLAALNHPFIDMLGHIDDAKVPSDHEAIIAEAKKLNKLIEINNNSLLVRRGSDENIRKISHICARLGVRVSISSDAHFSTMIGAVEPALKLFREENFPDELIVNRSAETFEGYLAERTSRLKTSNSIRKK